METQATNQTIQTKEIREFEYNEKKYKIIEPTAGAVREARYQYGKELIEPIPISLIKNLTSSMLPSESSAVTVITISDPFSNRELFTGLVMLQTGSSFLLQAINTSAIKKRNMQSLILINEIDFILSIF